MALGIGVIGCGVMGGAHAQTLATRVSGAWLAAVSDVDVARAAEVARPFEAVDVHADARDLILDRGVDAVVIASSDATHAELTVACLQAGKPVLCEKPLAPTAEASAAVVEAEAALGRRLVQVGFMRRYDAGYVHMKRTLDDGTIGGPVMVHCAHRNASVPPTYTSEMLVTSSGTHEIDVVRWLLGEELVAVTVLAPRSSRLAPEGLRDPQFLLLESESGILADVEVFVSAKYGYDIRCEVVAESGTVSLPPHANVLQRREGTDGTPVPPDFRGRFGAAYREQFQSWVHAVAAGTPDGPSAWDGYAASAVADACLESLATGRRVAVELPERPQLYAGAPGAAPATPRG